MTDIELHTLQRRCFALADEAQLDRSDRMDLAGFLLGFEVRSWSELAPCEWETVRDALMGWFAVRQIHCQKGLT